MTTALRERADIPVERTWNAESVYTSREEWDAAAKAVSEAIASLDDYRGRLSEGPAVLADWLELKERFFRDLMKLWVYSGMAASVDSSDHTAASMRDRARGLFGRLVSAAAFESPELLAIGAETLQKWMKAEGRLEHLGHYFERLEARRPHVRSAEVEALLGALSDPFSTATSIHGVLANVDLLVADATDAGGKSHEVGQGNVGALVTDPDRALRESAWKAYADAHIATKHTMATCVLNGFKQDVFLARARNYRSSLEASMLTSHVPVEVFHNLVSTFEKNLPTWHRYWRVRRRALGYDSLHPWDVKAPLGAGKPEVSYEQAIEWIAEGMRPLGDEYVRDMVSGLEEQRWVDVYPNRGKRAGAFSSGSADTHPFIMMSYSDDLFGLSTLAHELGHSMHSLRSKRTQRWIYGNYGLFAAEVASNFNQALVRAWLLENADDETLLLGVLEEAFSNFHRYFFVMPTLARFELDMHERVERGESPGADDMIGKMADLFAEGFGDEVEMDRERVGITWAQFHTHLYSSFYTYQYATGISAAHALAARVMSAEEGAVDDYLGFLSAGGSDFPLNILRRAGVDMTSPEPVNRAFETLSGLVDRLESIVDA